MTDLSPIALANQEQQRASNPFVSAWVSASAGSGKTKVLTDRVLNLLLTGCAPEKILCLTFTKTAASEMANRLTDILREWAIADEKALTKSLTRLRGEDPDAAMIQKARTLFAKVLDVKGGMKIMTIHSFCQSVLKRFPLEANLSPAFDVVDEKESLIYIRQAISNTLENPNSADDMAHISGYVGENDFATLMQTFTADRGDFKRLLSSHYSLESLIQKVYRALDIQSTDTMDGLIKTVYDGDDWEAFKLSYLTQKDDIRSVILKDPDRKPMGEAVLAVNEKIKAVKTAQATAAFLKIAYQILNAYGQIKKQNSVLDYDDLILETISLLDETGQAAWVLYKLDGGIDHILVDEAQDTSPDQWSIIRKLTEDFFAGETRHETLRTLFVVGDRKQSIYSFQGADPDEFEKMRAYFKSKIVSSDNVFEDVPLNISFRSTQPVLDLVNMVLQNNAATDGILLAGEDAIHQASRTGQAGLVEIWPVIQQTAVDKNDAWELPGIQHVADTSSQILAQKIADRIYDMMANKESLTSQNRPIRPGDVMVLVRRRNQFIGDLVRALKARQVPVAGVDRLVLTDHIAVQDLLSLGAFLLLPEDDLRLAEVLKSPLFNITEEALFDLAHGRNGSLWDAVQHQKPELAKPLKSLLNKADSMPPFELYSDVLSKQDGRTAFLKRLGPESNEALDEFLNLTFQFEQIHTPSLQKFLKWMQSGKVEIKRDLDQSDINAVRIMTVHGSKGLQAPIVFLPDTRKKSNKTPPLLWMNGVPVWVPKKETQNNICTAVKNRIQKSADQEYNRLMYVAMTRAKDRLYVCGYDGVQAAPQNNWYDLIAGSVKGWVAGELYTIKNTQTAPLKPQPDFEASACHAMPIPGWFYEMAPNEPVPPKPLMPSRPSDEEPALDSPLTEAQTQAMRRGTFIHQLLQVLPTVEPIKRRAVAMSLKPDDIDLPESLFQLFDKPGLQHLFSKQSQAEVPLTGTLKGYVVSGQVDRLVMTDTEVLIIDYKTNRVPPKSISDVPALYQKQMKAYQGLLENIFPDKKVRGFLLWTTDLTLMEIV